MTRRARRASCQRDRLQSVEIRGVHGTVYVTSIFKKLNLIMNQVKMEAVSLGRGVGSRPSRTPETSRSIRIPITFTLLGPSLARGSSVSRNRSPPICQLGQRGYLKGRASWFLHGKLVRKFSPRIGGKFCRTSVRRELIGEKEKMHSSCGEHGEEE